MEENFRPLVEVALLAVIKIKVLVLEGQRQHLVMLELMVEMAESREVIIVMVAVAELLVQRATAKTARIVKETYTILVLVVVVVLGIILAAAAAVAAAKVTVAQAIMVAVKVETEDLVFMDKERWVPHLQEYPCALVELEEVIGTVAKKETMEV